MMDGYQPKNRSEGEIATAMAVISYATKVLRKEMPGLPETAISVALINLGIQAGLRSTSLSTVVEYLHGAADHIEDQKNG